MSDEQESMAFDEKAEHEIYRQQDLAHELAAEFRAAAEAAKLERVLPEARSCDWCGIDLYTIDDHKTVDRQYMCHPCHLGFFPEQQNTQYPGPER